MYLEVLTLKGKGGGGGGGGGLNSNYLNMAFKNLHNKG